MRKISQVLLILFISCAFAHTQFEDEFGLDAEDFKKGPVRPPKKSAQDQPVAPEKSQRPQTDGPSSEKPPEPEIETSPAGPAGKGISQVRTDEDRTTRYITISGAVAAYFIVRDGFFDDALRGNASRDRDEDYFDPRFSIQIDARLDRNVRAVAELQNEDRDDQRYLTSLGALHVTSRLAGNDFRVHLEKAYLELSEFLLDGFTLQAGVIPHRYSLRADGQSFFLDFREAESPFATRADTHATGVLGQYRPVRVLDFTADAFYFVTSESGFERRDETVAGINLDLSMSKDALRESDEAEIALVRFFNLNFAAIAGDNNKPLWNFGFGFSYFLTNDAVSYTLELYGELLFQFGEYNRKALPPLFALRDQDHLAFGSYSGFKWTYREGGWQPFIDVSYWYLSGDDDDPGSNKNRDIVTYENIDTTLIIEDNDYGLDIDSNYWAIKCQIGTNLPIGSETMRLSLIYAYFERNDAPSGRTHKLGDEIDVRFSWEYTADVVFSLAAGVLWESQYLEEFFDEVGSRGKEHAFLLRTELSLVF